MWRLLLVAAALCAGCANDFDPASFVDKLRLLAVVANPPEVAPGEAVTLTATAVNPGGSTPTVTWDACLLPPPPATGESVNQACVTLMGGDQLVHLGDGATIATTMPAVTPSMVGLPDQTNGFYLPVRVRLDADGKSLVAFYSLRIYLGALSPNARNQNPTFTGMFTATSADAGASDVTAVPDAPPLLEVTAQQEVDLRALVTPESAETFVVYDGDPRTTPPRTVTEAVAITWYTTAGHFTNEGTGIAKPDTTLVLDKHLPASGSTIDLWAVARDDRGGSDVIHRALTFR